VDPTRILEHLLARSPRPEPLADLEAWWQRHHDASRGFDTSADRALAGAFASDRLGYAFASGFREALRRLVPQLGEARVALCATEAGGNRPSAIETALIPDRDGWRMTGQKKWTTLGTYAERLIVFASAGRDEGDRNRLTAVCIPADRAGVTVKAGHDAPFVPEITHASVTLRDVRVEPDERLDGDGYDRYLKPFRTVEDCHVHAATLAWLLQVARRSGWPRSISQRLVAMIAAIRALALGDPRAPAVHIAFGGLSEQMTRLLEDAEPAWAEVDSETRQRWQRDRLLLDVASTARARRLEVAWNRID
jgi:hypothetical protein